MTDTPRGYPVPASTDVVSLDAVQDLADAIDTDVTAVASGAGSALASHEADTTSIHGIANTALLVATSDAGTVATAMIADSAVTSVKIADGAIVDADVNASAAIAATKIAGTAVTQADTGTVTNTMLAGSIAPAKVTGTAVVTGDSRLSDARTPTAHAASHGTGQADAITIAPAQVTGTAVVNTLVDAKGDLFAATAADTPSRLAVGVAGTNPILTPDSSAASGLAWKSHADADVAKASTVGNLLTANMATGTDTLGTTAGFMPQATTPLSVIESSVEQAARGTRSLKVTTPGSAAYEGVTTLATLPLRRNAPVTFSVRLFSATGMSLRVGIFRTDAGYINTSTDVTLTPSTWTTVVFTAAPGAVGETGETSDAVVFVDTGASAQSGSFYCDDIGYWFGAGGVWQTPGVPIPNLGIRANPADSTQVQVWNPGNATWITV